MFVILGKKTSIVKANLDSAFIWFEQLCRYWRVSSASASAFSLQPQEIIPLDPHNSSDHTQPFSTLLLTVFNLEIHFKNGLKLRYWNLEQLTPSKLSSSGGWLIKLTFPASPLSLSSPPSCFSGSIAILFSKKNEFSDCCHFMMKRKQKNKVNKKSVNR